MHNFQQKVEEVSADKQVMKQAETQHVTACECPNCGGAYTAADKFCSECGMGLKGNSCLHCGAATQPNWEICPACGHNLQAELCSFCGGKMTPDDAFCPECGNPRTGIICSSCHTLNYRSFCRKCNAPLNSLAHEALEEARKDPKVQKAIAIAQELEELEQLLSEMAKEESTPPELPQISEENRELANQYKDLLAAFRGQKPQEKADEAETPKPAPKPKTVFSINIASKEDAVKKYKEKLAEMQATLASMIPDVGMTPQVQRDYYSARKVEILTKTKIKVPLYWICNAYGCQHNQPNECSEPFKGGKWYYEEREEVTKAWGHQ
jgi:predicted amidophosphoribosyltransferase